MRTLDFTYQTQDVGGPHIQRISIPLLTLVPLPLLQVKEADFDFDIQIVDALSADKDAAFSLKNGSSPEEEESTEGVKLRVSMAQASREGKTTEGAHRQHEGEGKDAAGRHARRSLKPAAPHHEQRAERIG